MITKRDESNPQKEQKRQLIINASLQVFSAEGYHKARMESIAELAGIGKGTIYEYFSSKLDLFIATMEDSYHVYYQVFEAETQRDNSMERLAYELFRTHIDFCQRNWKLANFLFKEQHSMGEEFESWMREMHMQQRQRIISAIQSAIDTKQIRPVDINVLYQVIMGIMAGLAFTILLEPEMIDIEDTCKKARDILMHGIALT